MATHLAHKLPWGVLAKFFLRNPVPLPLESQLAIIDAQEKKAIDHFARCLAAAVREFRDSDHSSEGERWVYDPRTWLGQREYHAGAWPGFYETLITGYMALNLILSDPMTIAPRFKRMHGDLLAETFEFMLGQHDGGHPPQLAEHLQQAFDGLDLKPMTADVAQILRDHAAMLFHCMYYLSGENEFLDADNVAPRIVTALWLRCRPA